MQLLHCVGVEPDLNPDGGRENYSILHCGRLPPFTKEIVAGGDNGLPLERLTAPEEEPPAVNWEVSSRRREDNHELGSSWPLRLAHGSAIEPLLA
jgi:hypothetical protein